VTAGLPKRRQNEKHQAKLREAGAGTLEEVADPGKFVRDPLGGGKPVAV